jgi:hypothetical protein
LAESCFEPAAAHVFSEAADEHQAAARPAINEAFNTRHLAMIHIGAYRTLSCG